MLSALAVRICCQAYTIHVGDILAANYNAGSIIRIDPISGESQRLGGTFSVPTDVAMDTQGNLYISEWSGGIKRLALATGVVETVMPSGSGPSQVWGISLGPGGDLFVTSRGNHALYRVHPTTGSPTLVTRGDQLYSPVGLDFLDDHHVVVACLLTNRLVSVSLLDKSQSLLYQGGGLDQPWGLAVNNGDIYVTGYDRKTLQRLRSGTLTTVATLEDFPYGLSVDLGGHLIVGLKGAGESVARLSLDGIIQQSHTGPLIRWVTGLEVSTLEIHDEMSTNHLSIPQLAIASSPSNAVVSWPWPSTGYVLQQNADLTTSRWAKTTNAITVVGGSNQMVVSLPTDNCYFRLSKP